MLRSLRVLGSDRVNVISEFEPIITLIREGKRWADRILGYDVQGRDHRIGDVQDLIVDDQTCDVRYLVVNVQGRRSGRMALLAPHWTHRINWGERKIYMDFSRQLARNSPSWAPTAPLTRDYETRLHDYYGRSPYWATNQGADQLDHRSRADTPETSLPRFL